MGRVASRRAAGRIFPGLWPMRERPRIRANRPPYDHRAVPPDGTSSVAGAVGDQQRPFGSGTVPAGGRGVTLPSGRGKPQRT
jgi:hypothetical protein